MSLQQQFMDGTGLMITLFKNSSDSLAESNQDFYLKLILKQVTVVGKTVVNIFGNNVFVDKRANAIHVLAYLQAWKSFLLQLGGDSAKDISALNKIADELYQKIPLVPESYKIAFEKFKGQDSDDFDFNLSSYPNYDNSFFESLVEINEKVKQNSAFSYIEHWIPQLYPGPFESLHEEKTYNNLLGYCVACINYISQYYDSTWPWWASFPSEEKDKLIAEGWTGKGGEKYIAINNIIDYGIDYLIRSQGYNDISAPILLYHAAQVKLDMKDYETALLYSKMADEIFNLLNRHPIECIDNRVRILSVARYKLYNNYSGIDKLANSTNHLESNIERIESRSNSVKPGSILLTFYNTLTDIELDRGNVSVADEWNNKALDFLYTRKGSKWDKGGGSHVQAISASQVPVHYREWKIAQAKNSPDSIEQTLSKAYWVSHSVEADNEENFGEAEIPLELKYAYFQNWANRNNENIARNAISDSKHIRESIQFFSALMHPHMRTRFFNLAQKTITNYNGILANNDTIITCYNALLAKKDTINTSQCIFNNLILFHGIQLLNERLIANALFFDDECKELFDKSLQLANTKLNTLIGLFRSDLYAKKMEERALTIQGIKDLLAVDYTQIQKRLNDKDIVIEFFKAPFWNDAKYNNSTPNNEWGYYAALLRHNDSPKIVPLSSTKDLPINNSQKGFSDRQFNKLSQQLWSPILPFLNNVDTIYFTPDAELHNIPIEYLPNNDGNPMSDKYNIYRLSSPRELLTKNQNVNKKETAALFGYMHYNDLAKGNTTQPTDIQRQDSIYHKELTDNKSLLRSIRSTVEDLPETKVEIKKINKLLKKKNTQCSLYTEYNATEAAFKALSGQAPNIIHIATHGKYWPKLDIAADKKLQTANFLKDVFGNPNFEDALSRSVLLFSGANRALSDKYLQGNGEDEVLTAREISSLNLNNVDLLVLSACQTGLGDIQEDGVFGLQRGFKKAGVKSMIMSLWEVEDDATQMLMSEFYKNYTSGQTKQNSLKAAQRAVREFNGKINGKRRDFSSPRYWAGFILLDGLN
jgi:CHAT domain-containing protein